MSQSAGQLEGYDLPELRLPHIATKADNILDADPFAVLDREGVGAMMRLAIHEGRLTRPDIKLGICGEHGGDPSSVEFCHELGLDYVSCSPFRVPIARLAAAQAALDPPRVGVKKSAARTTKKQAPKRAATAQLKRAPARAAKPSKRTKSPISAGPYILFTQSSVKEDDLDRIYMRRALVWPKKDEDAPVQIPWSARSSSLGARSSDKATVRRPGQPQPKF